MTNDNENSKEQRLLDTAFSLFTNKGIKNTSIQEIVDNANVAKGTFYLYFKDKYELQDILITKKSEKLFHDALTALRKNYIKNFADQIIFIINYVIDELKKKPMLLKFISKNLSWGVYNKSIIKIYENGEKDESGFYNLFIKGIKENNINIDNPEVTLFMIMEIISSTYFIYILKKRPLPIDDYKPYLYDTIRKFIQ